MSADFYVADFQDVLLFYPIISLRIIDVLLCLEESGKARKTGGSARRAVGFYATFRIRKRMAMFRLPWFLSYDGFLEAFAAERKNTSFNLSHCFKIVIMS